MTNDCKKRPRPHPRSEEIPSRDLFYQTLTDYSDEETQGIFEFMKNLKQADDKTSMFNRFCCAIQCYQSGGITYITLENGLLSILRDHKGLLDEFHQLKSGFASPVIRNNEKKEKGQSDVERTVVFLKKIEALRESVYKAFTSALAFSGDMEILVEQLDEILHYHTSLKQEFETFLVDSRLLKRKREESVEVTPSYQIRPEAEVGSSSNEDALKDPKLSEEPPLGFNRVLEWFCGGKEVRQKYKTHPKLAATYMLPTMQTTLENMTRAKTIRAINVYNRASQKGNVKK
ncbi:hypothetical protein Bca101_083252 [Brassica carinata]